MTCHRAGAGLIRFAMRTAQLLSAAVLVVLAACGGEKKPAQAPEPVVGANSGQADMPPSPSEKSGEAAPGEQPKTNAAETQSLAIKVAPMKLVPAKPGKNDKPVEVKADGSINVGGKTVAKISGDQVDATDGSGTLVTVGMDGSLVGQGIKPGFKFVGDELQGENGTKLSIGDDGTINATNKDGKSEVMGKLEGGEKAKRAGVLVALLMVMAKPVETTPPAKPKK